MAARLAAETPGGSPAPASAIPGSSILSAYRLQGLWKPSLPIAHASARLNAGIVAYASLVFNLIGELALKMSERLWRNFC